MAIKRIELAADTIGPVRAGHPWVYASGMKGRAPAGTPILLVDGRKKPLAFALADEGDITARVLGRNPDRIQDLLKRRIQLAAAIRRRIIPEETNAYRLLNGPGDGLPGLVVDMYGDLAVLRIYGKCWEPHLDAIVDALSALEGVERILRRFGVRKVDGRSGGETLWGEPPGEKVVVKEYGLRFLARPLAGQKTGLFLDQREHRHFIGQRSRGLRISNLFGYTGGFSVHAAAGGASRVVTVDIAEEAIQDAKENFRLNGLSLDPHGFECCDAFGWKSSDPLDLLICDPPALSHGKKSDKAAAAAYRDLASACGKQLPKGGLFATASCTARLNRPRWERAISDGLRSTGQWSWLWRADEPPDHPTALAHPEGRYLKFSLLVRRR
jgi:23S rRNA (cytosine1962-C5)-methyltransferase